jgi:hypothetical protein
MRVTVYGEYPASPKIEGLVAQSLVGVLPGDVKHPCGGEDTSIDIRIAGRHIDRTFDDAIDTIQENLPALVYLQPLPVVEHTRGGPFCSEQTPPDFSAYGAVAGQTLPLLKGYHCVQRPSVEDPIHLTRAI